MVAGLITFALVGMLQSLGALADTVHVDPTWRSDTADEDDRGHAAGRGPSSPDAIGRAAAGSQHRGEPTLDVLDDAIAPAYSVQLLSQESRAPRSPQALVDLTADSSPVMITGCELVR